MGRFNRPGARPRGGTGVITTEAVASGTTAPGHAGYARGTKSELYLLAVGNFVGQHIHHEAADARDARFRDLVRRAAVEDPVWTFELLRWLRRDVGLRTAPLVGACEFVHARLAEVADTATRCSGVPHSGHAGSDWSCPHDTVRVRAFNAYAGQLGLPDGDNRGIDRALVDAVLRRADEPGELVAYWTRNYGRALPKSIKRGVADALQRLGTEFNYLKWDSEGRGYRFADLLRLTHPGDHRSSRQRSRRPGEWQRDLFRYVTQVARANGAVEVPESLQTLTRRRFLMSLPVQERRAVLEDPGVLREAGMTWEALAGWLQGPMDRRAWEAIIPAMGYTALLRNLRNFDQAGVSDEVAQRVVDRLVDPDAVARSREFPFRFLAAFRASESSLRWAYPLEKALQLSLANVPRLDGRTLVLVDRSPSMWHSRFSERSSMPWADAAAVFGAALALRAEHADLVEFWRSCARIEFRAGDSVLATIGKFHGGHNYDGTDIPTAVRAYLRVGFHTRLVIVTDEQTRPGWLPSNVYNYGGSRPCEVDDLVPADVPTFIWNLVGYERGAVSTVKPNRWVLGGLTDAAFRAIPLLEAGRDERWPWRS